MTKATNAQLEAAMRSEAAISTLVAQKLGMSRQAVEQRIQKSPALQKIKADVESQLLDLAEGQVVKLIRNGRERTILWYLERKGEARGYGNKLKTTIALSDEQIEAAVQSFGGNVVNLKAFRAGLTQQQS